MIQNSTEEINGLIKIKEPRTFENTIQPLAKWEAEVALKSANLDFYKQVSTSKEIRTAAMDHEKEFGKYRTELWMREDLYHAVKDYKTAAVQNNKWDELDAESKRYVDKLLDDFETGGMKLNKE